MDFMNGYARSADMTSMAYESVTPSDANDLRYFTVEIVVGQAGSLSVEDVSGAVVDITNLPVGKYQMAARKIRATGTNASDISVFY